ncbi:BrnT family toxin [Oxalobacteraceae bacterium OTU3CAMAD1]|nr:BrnT family toxin [Oxalobacteraceae bacterium OTU3CAMAD1]
MNYTHDPKKLAQNVAKHGVWFDIAEGFDWEHAIVRVDSRNDYREPRLVSIGPIGNRLYVMVFSLRETAVRIISLRKANRREVKEYETQA